MSLQEGFQQLRTSLQASIIGQPRLVERLILTLLADGHLLVEGAPGLAKTKAINALAERIEGEFKRVQFTPDLLPGDITGTEIYRAPAKVQSALLEAMAERQVTVGGVTRPLPQVFMVMATQNPIEQEGTYPLPEAQLDRFLMHVKIDYPDASAEQEILRLARGEAMAPTLSNADPLTQADILKARQEALALHMSDAVEQYLVQLIIATREPGKYSEDLDRWIEFGASPRGTIALDRCARAHAWLAGRDYVSPDDVRAVAHDVLRHRILLSFEAEARGMTSQTIIDELLQRVPVA